MWTWSIVWIFLIWSTYTILFIYLQGVRDFGQLFEYSSSDYPIQSSSSVSRASLYVNTVNCFKISHLISPHFSPARTRTCSIVWIPFIWSFYPFIFIRLQNVGELCQLFKPISWIWSSRFQKVLELGQIIWIPIIWFIRLQPVRELYRWFNTSNLIIPSSSSPDCTWTWSIVWKLLNGLSSSSITRSTCLIVST